MKLLVTPAIFVVFSADYHVNVHTHQRVSITVLCCHLASVFPLHDIPVSVNGSKAVKPKTMQVGILFPASSVLIYHKPLPSIAWAALE